MTEAVPVLFAYLDESARHESHYYMGALLVDSHSLRKINGALDEVGRLVASRVDGFDPREEFHGYDVFQGKRGWKDVSPPIRVDVSSRVIRAVAESEAVYFLRGIHVEKLKRRYGSNAHDPHQLAMFHALESVQETVAENSSDMEVMAIADEHHAASDSRTRFAGLKQAAASGYTGRALTAFLDTVYFGPSHHSRLLQAADMLTFFATRSRHETERHPLSQSAMREIRAWINSITIREYVWP